MYEPRIGRKIGRLTVIEKVSSSDKRDGKHTYRCKCDCGNEVLVNWKSLGKGAKRSCGCLVKERSEKFAKLAADGLSGRKHPLGNVYRGMLRRCHDEKHHAYKYYGARGIAVCDRWRESFQAFVDDMGSRPSDRHSIDRIDVNGNYEPSNCRWATAIEQAENQRVKLVVNVATIKGVTRTVGEWCRKLGISENAKAKVIKAIKSGTPSDLAVMTAYARKKAWEKGENDYSKCEARAKAWLAKNQSN